MIRWELGEFKVEKDNNVLNFETRIMIPEMYRLITFIYDGQRLMVDGSELELGHSIYEIESRLESLLETSLIKVLSKYSKIGEYLRAFGLFGTVSYPDGTTANLHYTYNDKFLDFGSFLVNPPDRVRQELCKVPLTVRTNAASNIKSFYELLTEICRSAVRIDIDLHSVNEILRILLQRIKV